MNLEDIKIGETYYTPAKVIGIGQNGKPRVKVMDLIDVYCYPDRLHPITPSDPPTEVDPCRLFKKGDIVEPVERWGRKLRIKAGQYRIEKDEVDNRVIITHCETGFSYAAIDAVFLKLVNPVDELEPYSVQPR